MNFQYLGVDAFADFDSKTCASPVCSCFSPRHLNTPEVKSHPYSYLWLGWSLMGLIGTGLNSFVLSIFWTERQSLNTTVNTMIWYVLCNVPSE